MPGHKGKLGPKGMPGHNGNLGPKEMLGQQALPEIRGGPCLKGQQALKGQLSLERQWAFKTRPQGPARPAVAMLLAWPPRNAGGGV
ncbi:MAG: hypothetical protein AB2556_19750 [Candidatus Thiodiazotropha sp.]